MSAGTRDMAGTAAPWVTVEKRKWDGQVSGRWRAILTSSPPGPWVWHTPAGTCRERPWRHRSDVRPHREVAVAGPEGWLLTLALDETGAPSGAEVDAILPVKRVSPALLAFVDLDLDLDLDLAAHTSELKDEEQFHERAAAMGYPLWVQRSAWKSLWHARERFRSYRWPFGPALAELAADAPPEALRPVPAGRT